MACEDFPCCGHESGCCPDFDESGRQLNMKCVCGAVVDINSRYSLCEGCLRRDDEEFDDLSLDFDDDDHYPGEDMDGDHDSAMTSAGFGTDEDYGYYGGEDDWLDGSHEE